MTVADLIERLSLCPPDAKVILGLSRGSQWDLGRPVTISKVEPMDKHFDRSDAGPFVWLE